MKIFNSIINSLKTINKNLKKIFLYDCNEYIVQRKIDFRKNQTNAFFENSAELTSEKTVFALFFLFLFSSLAIYYVYIDLKNNITKNDISLVLDPMVVDIANPLVEDNNIQINTINYKIKSGDTLIDILTKQMNISASEAFAVIKELNKFYSIKNLGVGQTIVLKYTTDVFVSSDDKVDYTNKFFELRIKNTDNDESVIISVNEDTNTYVGRIEKTEFLKQYERYVVKIKNSMYVDGVDAGIPPAVVIDLIKYFSFDVDFVRDIRENDEFEVFFESYYTDKGKREKHGDIIFARLKTRQNEYNLYRYNSSKTGFTYFNEIGVSNNKSLLKTPINGARISSNFSKKRKHPILGYTRAHKGVDFAAPIGTPFFAGGSGTVVAMKKGYNGGYGNYMKIRHNDSYSTVYAHLSKFSNKMFVGKKVQQGEVIAYVGNTGMSTGPHLHYEIVYKGRQINPASIKSIASVKLQGKELTDFMDYKNKIDIYRKNTLVNVK